MKQVVDTREHETAVRTFLNAPLMSKRILTAASYIFEEFLLVHDIRAISTDDHTLPSLLD